MAKEEAKTTIDSLADLIKDKGRMELGKAAQTLGISPTIVENWAKVLEKGGLVRISYEVGRMYVEPAGAPRGEEKAYAATVEAERTTLATEAVFQRNELDKLVSQINEIDLSVKAAERIFADKFPELEKQLDGINKIYKALENESSQVENIKKGAQGNYDNLNKKISDLYGKIEGIDTNTVQVARERLLAIRDELKKANELENQLTALEKSKDRALEAIKKSVEDQLKTLEKEIDRSKKNITIQLDIYREQIDGALNEIKDRERSLRGLSDQLATFRRDKEAAKKALEESRTQFNDQFIKAYTHMETTGTLLSKEVTSMMAEIAELKVNFGEASKVYDRVQVAKNEIAQAQDDIAKMREELGKIIDEINEIEGGKLSAEAKAKKTAKLKERMKSVADQKVKVGQEIEDVSRDMESEKKEGE